MAAWYEIHALPGGHRLFRKTGADSSFVYIADESGDDPDLTEDGPLYIDMSAPIEIGSTTASVSVSSIREGRPYSVTVGLADALWLSDRYSMALRTTGASLYRAVRTAS